MRKHDLKLLNDKNIVDFIAKTKVDFVCLYFKCSVSKKEKKIEMLNV